MAETIDRVALSNATDFVTGAVRRYLPEADAFAQISEHVSTIVGQHSQDELGQQRDDEWSATRILGHMIAYAEGSHEHLYQMSHMTDPLLRAIDDAAVAETERWDSRRPGDLALRLTKVLDDTADLLKSVPDSSWGRAGIHPIMGRRSIRQATRRGAQHLQSHVEQLEATLSE